MILCIIIKKLLTINKSGFCVIKKNKINEWNNRLIALKNTIRYWLNPENKTVEIIQLFYNS